MQQQHLLRQFDNPRRGHNDVSVNSHQARFLDLLHHETADFVVVGRFAPRTADGDDLLQHRIHRIRTPSLTRAKFT